MQAGQQQLPDDELHRRCNELYETYGKPLEPRHHGHCLAVSQEGRTIRGSDIHDVAERAAAVLGPSVFLYKIGERAVGKLRRGALTSAAHAR